MTWGVWDITTYFWPKNDMDLNGPKSFFDLDPTVTTTKTGTTTTS